MLVFGLNALGRIVHGKKSGKLNMKRFNQFNLERINGDSFAPNHNVFAINSGRDITNELIDSFFMVDNAKSSELIIRPKSFTLEDTLYLDNNLNKDNYYYQLGFITHKNHLTKSDVSIDISFTPFTDINSLRNENNRTIEEYFFKRWPQYVYEQLKIEYGKYVDSHIQINHSWKIVFQDKYIGLISIFPSKDCLKNNLMQIGWVWIDENIDSTIRKETHKSIVNHLIDISDDLIQAGVALFNIQSKKFFFKLGFELKCIHIIKK